LFFWLELNRCIDTRTFLPKAIERGVAFMPGEPFYAENKGARGTLRLNFSHASEEQSERGLAILAELIRNPGN
jgi:DNA-binding transcriptional MocR family regulator